MADVITIQVRTVKRVAIAVAVCLAAFSLATVQWFLSPSTDDPTSVDAVVVLGGEGQRVRAARDLVADGVTSQVWISSDWIPRAEMWEEQACRPEPRGWPIDDAEVTCFELDQETTRGEARYIGELAEAEGWDSVAVVATVDQVTRARRLIERCYDGDLYMVSVPHPDPMLLRVIYEWGSGVKATLLRGC